MRAILVVSSLFLVLNFINTTNSFELGMLSSIFSAGKFIYELLNQVYSEPEKVDPELKKIQIIYPDLTKDNAELKKAIERVPKIKSLIDDRKELQRQFSFIENAFNSAVSKYEFILKGLVEDRVRYIHFREDYERDLDRAMWDVRDILIKNVTSSNLIKDFKTDLMIYEDVCKSGMSNMQLLYDLYEKYVIATAKYFVTKNLIFNFLQVFQNQDLDPTRKMLRLIEESAFHDGIAELKKTMAASSLYVHRCSLPEGSYDGFHLFQKYYIKNPHRGSWSRLKNKNPFCESLQTARKDECEDENGPDSEPCLNFHPCSNKLYCTDMFTDEESKTNESRNSTIVCVNDDVESNSRYSYVEQYVNSNAKIECPFNSRKAIVTWFQDKDFGWVEPCDCVCAKEEYFVDTRPVYSDASSNKIVTGAKLTMKDKTLYLQILEGQLLENGRIDSSNVSLIPKLEELESNPEFRVPITWNGFREFSLAEVKLPIDRVITGLKFDINLQNFNDNTRRIGLTSFSTRFNFSSGELFEDGGIYFKTHLSEPGRRQLNLSNCDAPRKSQYDNLPDSEPDQYLRISLTDLKKDGGQTTIPYIETQLVVTNPLSPLTGIGLFHKSEPGFGGFMGLRLLSYNLTSQIADEFLFDKGILLEGLQKLNNFKNKLGFIDEAQSVQPLPNKQKSLI